MSIKATRYILNMPKIDNLIDLSNYLNLSPHFLHHLTHNAEHFYKEVLIPKSNGKLRLLACPSKELKVVQAWILREILEKINLHPASMAFIKGKNIKDNVEVHADNQFFVCMDIENFFGTIPRKWVYNLFSSLGYNKYVCMMFTNLCTYKGRLPQGGVTSPILSNILCLRLDNRISGYVGRRNIAYSRYADDITLSANSPKKLFPSISFVKTIIQDEGFTLNNDKYRIMRPGTRKKITGLVITDNNKIGIGSYKKRKLRANIYWFNKGNLSEDEHLVLYYHLCGWMVYLKGIDFYRYQSLKQYWKRLDPDANVP